MISLRHIAAALLLATGSSASTAFAEEERPPAEEGAPRSFYPAEPEAWSELAERRTRVRPLVDLAYPRQDFGLTLTVSSGSGVVRRGRRFEIVARSDRPAFLLLLNVDPTGTVSVLYPMTAAELRPSLFLRETFEVVPPYGTEYLKLFAFRSPPEHLAAWIDRRIDAMDPELDRLLELLEEPGAERGETRLRVATVGGMASGKVGTDRWRATP